VKAVTPKCAAVLMPLLLLAVLLFCRLLMIAVRSLRTAAYRTKHSVGMMFVITCSVWRLQEGHLTWPWWLG
jgi:hypothetical protein